MDEHPTLHSLRLGLTPLRAGDVPALTALLRTAAVARWWGPVDPADIDPDDPDVVQLVVRDRRQFAGDVLGLIQYSEEVDPMYRHAGIDVALHPAVHGQGLGREAIRTVAHHLLDTRRHHRLTVDPSAANTRAIRAYTAVGFRPVGVLRRYERDPAGTGWHDGLLMDLLAGELVD